MAQVSALASPVIYEPFDEELVCAAIPLQMRAGSYIGPTWSSNVSVIQGTSKTVKFLLLLLKSTKIRQI